MLANVVAPSFLRVLRLALSLRMCGNAIRRLLDLWPSVVPSWLRELWWAECVSVQDGPVYFFQRTHDEVMYCVQVSKPIYDRKLKAYREGEIIPAIAAKKEVS